MLIPEGTDARVEGSHTVKVASRFIAADSDSPAEFKPESKAGTYTDFFDWLAGIENFSYSSLDMTSDSMDSLQSRLSLRRTGRTARNERRTSS